MSTSDNLKEAFAGESQANRKYLAFAKKAEEEGYPQVAKLFRAGADAETVHAHAHLRAMKGINSTLENLQAAIDGEGHEFKQMYPGFVTEAEKEGNKPAFFESVKSGSDLPETKIFVCQVCGNTIKGEAPEKCPVCGAAKGKFNEIA